MKLSQIFAEKRPTLSFEVFPPKTSDTYDSVKFAAEKIASLKPDFMSVTYGAGGGTSKYTADIAEDILTKHDVTPLAHLTCVSSDKKTVENTLSSLKIKRLKTFSRSAVTFRAVLKTKTANTNMRRSLYRTSKNTAISASAVRAIPRVTPRI